MRLDVDVTQRVDLRAEVAAEHPERFNEHGPARVGVVSPRPLQQFGHQPVGGLSADRLPKACHRRGIALDRGVPPDVPVVVDLDLFHVSGSFKLREHRPGLKSGVFEQVCHGLSNHLPAPEPADDRAGQLGRHPGSASVFATLMPKPKGDL
jgi:hypothetical protein